MSSNIGTINKIASKLASLAILGLFISCSPEEIQYSVVPTIEFESYEILKNNQGKDSLINLTIYYEDGDGDLGLTDADTAPPFNFGSPFFHNLPILYLVRDSSGFNELINPITNEPYGNGHERLPLLTPTGKTKSISGTITTSLPANPLGSEPGEVRFEITLIDRNLNISNTVETPTMILVH